MKALLPTRLKAARIAAGYKKLATLCEKHNLHMSNYSQHETGVVMPRDSILRKYSEIFDVNFNWLKFGTGLPYDDEGQSPKQTKLFEELETLNKILQSRKLPFEKTLMHNIVKETIEKLNELPGDPDPVKIADLIVGAYSDITATETDPDIQLLMVPSAVSSSIRFL